MKEKKPGDHIILRLKNTESPLILEWINNQSNLSDAIRYLVEEEIKTHSVRDLQEFIPAKRKPLETHDELALTEEDPDDQRIPWEKAQLESDSSIKNEETEGRYATEYRQQVEKEDHIQPSPEQAVDQYETEEKLEAGHTDETPTRSQSELTRQESEYQNDSFDKDAASNSQNQELDQSNTKRESLEETEQEEEDNEFSDDIIDHWLNI